MSEALPRTPIQRKEQAMTIKQYRWTERVVLTVLLLTGVLLFSGCGKTYQQKWYQLSVAYTGTVDSVAVLVESGVLDAEDIKPYMPGIEQANEAIKALLPLAETCDNNKDQCRIETWNYLVAQVTAILATVDGIVQARLVMEGD